MYHLLFENLLLDRLACKIMQIFMQNTKKTQSKMLFSLHIH